MDILQGFVITLIIIQSVLLLILAVALIIIFFWIKEALDKINGVLNAAEDIAHGVQSATKAGLVDLIGKGVSESVKLLSKKRSKSKS